jgi:hypothetical protein
MDKSGRVSDGRETVSAPGPKDSGSERPGPESRGGEGWTKGNPVVPAFDSQAGDSPSPSILSPEGRGEGVFVFVAAKRKLCLHCSRAIEAVS